MSDAPRFLMAVGHDLPVMRVTTIGKTASLQCPVCGGVSPVVRLSNKAETVNLPVVHEDACMWLAAYRKMTGQAAN